jgi:mannosyltransferase OCH1-like enzyme
MTSGPRYNSVSEDVEYFFGKDIKLSPNFEWIEHRGKKYTKIFANIYNNGMSFYVTKKHPFFQIDGVKYKNIIPKTHNIPRIVWQTMNKEPEKGSSIYEASKTFKNQEGWKYNFVDDDMAEKFLSDNFEPEVLSAFKVLKPGAFKADLLRACLLYIHGGVYADIKLNILVPLDSMIEGDLVLVSEIDRRDLLIDGIWNGFIASVPKHPYLKKVIDNIVDNVKKRFKVKGTNLLSVTGPLLYKKSYDMCLKEGNIDDTALFLQAIHMSPLDNKYYISRKKDCNMLISWPADESYRRQMKNNYADMVDDIYDIDLHRKLFN